MAETFLFLKNHHAKGFEEQILLNHQKKSFTDTLSLIEHEKGQKISQFILSGWHGPDTKSKK